MLKELNKEELRVLIKQRLDGTSGFQLEKLRKMLNTDTAKLALESYIGHTHWLLGLENDGKPELMEYLEKELEANRKTASYQLSEFIESSLRTQTLNITQLEKIFNQADIPLDTAITKSQLLAISIDKIPKPQLLEAIKKYFQSGPIKTSLEVSVAFNFLPIGIAMSLNNQGIPISLNEMEDIRQKAIKAIEDNPENI